MAEVTLVEAVNLALARAMQEDPDLSLCSARMSASMAACSGATARLAETVRTRTGDGYPAGRAPDQRLVCRNGCTGPETCRRDPVHGFIFPCIDQLVNTRVTPAASDPRPAELPMFLRAPCGAGIVRPTPFRERRSNARAASRITCRHSIFAERAYGSLHAASAIPTRWSSSSPRAYIARRR